MYTTCKPADFQKCLQCLIVLIELVYRDLFCTSLQSTHGEQEVIQQHTAEGTETFTEAAVKLGTCLDPLITVPAAPVIEAGEIIIDLTQHLSKSC